MLPRVKRRVTFTRMDPALREQPAPKAKKRKSTGAESPGRRSEGPAAGAAAGGSAGTVPKQGQGGQQAAELTLEDIVGSPGMASMVGDTMLLLRFFACASCAAIGCMLSAWRAGGGAAGWAM